MEEKKRFPRLRKWFRNIGLALGITASTLSLGTEKANAQEINSDTGKAKTPVEETMEQDNYANTRLAQTNLDKLFEENARLNGSSANINRSSADQFTNATKSVDDSATKVSNVANSIKNVANSVGNVRNISNLDSAINSVKSVQNSIENLDNNFNKADASIKGTEKTVSQLLETDSSKVKNEDNKEQEIENKEIKEEPVTEQVKEVETKSENNVQENSSMNNQELAKKMMDGAHLSAITAYPDDKESALSDEIVSLKRQISEARYNDNSELASILVAKHDELLKQRYDLTVERLSKSQNQDQSTISKETTDSDNVSQNITEKETENIQEITQKDTTPQDTNISNETNNKYDDFKEVSKQQEHEVKSSNSSTFRELPPQVYNPSHEKIEVQKQSPDLFSKDSAQEIEQEVKAQKTENKEQLSYEEATLKENKIKNASELNNVSIGQMGDYKPAPEEKAPDKKVNGYNLEELLKVSEGQMGIWNEIEEILDEDIAKNGVVTEQKEQNNSKIEETEKAQDPKQEFNESIKVNQDNQEKVATPEQVTETLKAAQLEANKTGQTVVIKDSATIKGLQKMRQERLKMQIERRNKKNNSQDDREP